MFGDSMARVDAIVLGAGIVGTSIALHLAKRGLAVALVDRRAPGEETSYGNAGVIEGNTVFPPAFPSDPIALLRIALKRAPEANYHLSFLPQVVPWLIAFRAASRPERLIETARLMRPLFARALPEHEALLAEAGAERFLRKTGWLKLYRSDRAFDALKREFALAQEFGMPQHVLDPDGARELEPSLAPVFRHAVHWPRAASISNPLAVTQAYAARFASFAGVVMRGDARGLRRANAHWRLETAEGPLDAEHAVVALGPFAPDVLEPLGIGCRSASSAAITATTAAPATPRSRGRWSTLKTAIASRRWSRASGSPPGPSLLRAMRRRRRCSSTVCSRRRGRSFHLALPSRTRRGWAAGRALRIPAP